MSTPRPPGMTNGCKVSECIRPVHVRGLCENHYNKWRRNGNAVGPFDRDRRRTVCASDGCNRPAFQRGLCTTHYAYYRYRKMDMPPRAVDMVATEIVVPDPVSGPKRTTAKACSIDGCRKVAIGRGWCSMHYDRWRRYGDVNVATRAISPETWRGDTGRGYVMINVGPEHPGYPNANKYGKLFEHTAVMAQMLGRSLREGETVHHKNGFRWDNDPSNLELWWRGGQPAGQRIADLVAWARCLLTKYGHEFPETDPTTGSGSGD